MNVTVGVALITALSTLSAGALASYTSLRIHRRQVEAQHEIFSSEQAERENAQHRQLRRDAYVKLLTYVDEIADVLQECWEEKPPADRHEPTSGNMDKARRLLNSIESPLNTVYLEGPQDIMGTVGMLKEALWDSFNRLHEFAYTHAGEQDSLLHITHREDYEIPMTHMAAKLAFIDAARGALGYIPGWSWLDTTHTGGYE